MEGICVSGSPPPSVDIFCANDLNRSNSNASALTAGIFEDILQHSPDDSMMWTDEKHSSFLEHLEVSFVKQLHQSISLFDQCSNLDERDKGIPQMHPRNPLGTSQQLVARVLGCWEEINRNSGDPQSHVSVESLRHIERPWGYRSKRIGTKRSIASAHTTEPLTLCDTENHPKVVKFHRSNTSSPQYSASNQYCDSLDLVKEGTGQNFADEEDETNSITKSRVKRLKTEFAE